MDLPPASDTPALSALAAAGRLAEIPPGQLVGILRRLMPDREWRLSNAIALHLSDLVTERLSTIVRGRNPRIAEDIVERAHGAVIAAILDPGSADCRELVDHFDARLVFRAVDAARVERRYRGRHLQHETDADGEPLPPPGLARHDGAAGLIEVERLLTRIRDPRKRLAFRLFMDGMRIRQGEPSIAMVLGVDPKTAKKWIEEAKSILAANLEMGV